MLTISYNEFYRLPHAAQSVLRECFPFKCSNAFAAEGSHLEVLPFEKISHVLDYVEPPARALLSGLGRSQCRSIATILLSIGYDLPAVIGAADQIASALARLTRKRRAPVVEVRVGESEWDFITHPVTTAALKVYYSKTR